MDDRKASLVAILVGGAAVGGFWLARPRASSAPLRLVLQQNFPIGGIGADRDAAAAFRLELPPAVREALEDSLPVVFRIVDRKGRIYPLSAMTDPAFAGNFKLPTGYAETPEEPRLQAALADKPLASVRVGDLPPAQSFKLDPPSDAPIRLLYRGGPWLEAEAKRPMPPEQRWRIVARRTRYAAEIGAVAELPPRNMRWATHRLMLPFAGQADAVEVEIQRTRFEKVNTVVRLKGMRLVSRFGGTALVVDKTVPIANEMGARILLPMQDLGPRRALKHPDPRSASVSLIAIPPWAKPTPDGSSFLRSRPPTVEILSPRPESLGLRELHIASASVYAKAKAVGPTRAGPFEAVVRLTFFKPVVIDNRTMVVPVENAPPAR